METHDESNYGSQRDCEFRIVHKHLISEVEGHIGFINRKLTTYKNDTDSGETEKNPGVETKVSELSKLVGTDDSELSIRKRVIVHELAQMLVYN